MRSIEEVLFTLGLLLVAFLSLGAIAFFLSLGARRRLAGLEQTIGRLNAEVMGMSGALQRAGLRSDGSWVGAPAAANAQPPQYTPAPPPEMPEAAPAPDESVAPEPDASAVPAEDVSAVPVVVARRPSLEETLALRWGVWLGAAALMLSGIFLIRYAVEEGLLGPAARCVLAALLGAALIGAGDWLHRRPLSRRIMAIRPDYAPPALTAGGIATLLGAAYGASVLYGLLPLILGFALMAGVCLLGLLLSLRQGPLVAAVGLAGAFLTPALVQTGSNSLPGLFAYLLVVTAATMAVVRYTAWGWLGWSATIGGAVWVLIGTTMTDGTGLDTWAPALFVPLAAALHLFLLPRDALDQPLGQRLAFVSFIALGLALLPVTMFELGLAWPVGVLLLSVVAMLRAWDEPRLTLLPGAAAGLGLLSLGLWRLPSWQPTGEVIVIEGVTQSFIPGDFAPEALTSFLVLCALLGAAHLLVGLIQERRGARPLPWAGLAAGVPVLAMLIAYARVRDFALDSGWAFAALALAALLTAMAARAAREGSGERAGIHAAGAMAALTLGVAMVLRDQWLTLAISLFLPPLAWIAAQARLRALRTVALAIGLVVVVRLVLNPYVLVYAYGPTPLMNGLWIAYALPAAAFAVTAWLLLREGDDRIVAAFEGAAVLLASLFVLLQIRHGTYGGKLQVENWAFAETALDATALGLMALGLYALANRWTRPIIGTAARVLALGALGTGGWLFLFNPWTQSAQVGQWPIFNLVLAAYAVPGLLAAWAAARVPELRASAFWHRAVALYAMAAILAWVTFEVWALFHAGGSYRPRRTFSSELWAYSGAWLALGGVWFWLGIRRANRELRLAAFAVIGLATGKVFLVDMGALVGLWRVLSLLGLGLALIGLGAVYQRFVLPRPPPPVMPGSGAAPPA